MRSIRQSFHFGQLQVLAMTRFRGQWVSNFQTLSPDPRGRLKTSLNGPRFVDAMQIRADHCFPRLISRVTRKISLASSGDD
jgi:hypothetical protein